MMPGFDVAFVGPYDLSQSLAFPGQVRHRSVKQSMPDAVQKARKSSKHIGIYRDDVAPAVEYRRIGVSYLPVSIDRYLLISGTRTIVSRLKQ